MVAIGEKLNAGRGGNWWADAPAILPAWTVARKGQQSV